MTKRTKIIISIVAALVIIGGGVAGAVALSKQADDTAATYKKDVLAKVQAIREGPEMSDRAKLVREHVSLPSVFLGEQLSSQYRDALSIRDRYDTLIKDSKTFFDETVTLYDAPTATQALGSIARSSSPIPSEPTDANISKVEDAAQRYGELATKLGSYTLAPQYTDDLKGAIENTKASQKFLEEIADILKTKGSNLTPQIQKVASEYAKTYGKLRDFMIGPFTDSAKDQAARLPNQAKEVDAKYESFINSLK